MIKTIKYLPLWALSGSVRADLLLSLGDILPDPHETRVEFGIDYLNTYSDYDINSNLGIRYGVNSDIEVYGRTTDANHLILGLNGQLSPDNDTAALLGFAEISKAKIAMVGLTAYRSIDPVVLFITTGYQYSTTPTINHLAVNPGNLWFIKPSVGFAANSEITLTSGLNLNFRQPDIVNGIVSGGRTTQTQLELGLGYSISDNDT